MTDAEMNETLHVDWHSDVDSNEWTEYLIHWVHSYRLQRTKGARCCGKLFTSRLSDYALQQGLFFGNCDVD